MPDLLQTISYFIKIYPKQSKISISWIMMLLFLSDLISCVYNDKRLFSFCWKRGRFCPFSKEVDDLIMHSICFSLKGDTTKYNHRRILVSLSNPDSLNSFDFNFEEKKIFDYVIKNTSNFDWEEMLSLTNSTFPFINNSEDQNIDILNESREYKQRIKFDGVNS